MSTTLSLLGQPRLEIGRQSLKKVRSSGNIPAVLYGKKIPPQAIQVKKHDLEAVLQKSSSENILVDLKIESSKGAKTYLTLVQEIQHDPLEDTILHLDFNEVSQTDNIAAEVPVEIRGEAVGVKQGGGLLELILRELHVECLPKNLPNTIILDISGLDIGQIIHVREVPLPEGVKALNDPDLTVVTVAAPRVSDSSDEPAATTQQPEAIKEKQKEAES